MESAKVLDLMSSVATEIAVGDMEDMEADAIQKFGEMAECVLHQRWAECLQVWGGVFGGRGGGE